MGGYFKQMEDKARATGGHVSQGFKDGINTVKGGVASGGGAVSGGIKGAFGKMSNAFKDAGKKAPTVQNVFGGLQGAIKGPTIQDVFGGLEKYMDPLDISGRKSQERAAEMEKLISSQHQSMNDFLGTKPTFKSIVGADGQLGNLYKMGDATPATASVADLIERKKWLDDIGGLMDPEAVKAGGDFRNAQNNVGLLQQRAFGTETSPWAQKLYDQQRLDQSNMMDRVTRDQALSQEQVRNALAMQGGLDGGARERLAKSAGRDAMMARQGVFRQGAQDRLGIGIQDEQNRLQLQSMMPGMNMQLDAYNTGLQRDDVTAKLNQDMFNKNMGMQRVGMLGSWGDANLNRETQVSLFNAGSKNDAAMFNAGNAIKDRQLGNMYDLDTWNTHGSVLGNQFASDAMMRSGNGRGGLFGTFFGG
jgi:hypothetical protein